MSEVKITLDSGYVYSPHWEREKRTWRGQGDRCCAAVANGGRSVSFHQCNNLIKVWRDVIHRGTHKNLGYCAIHDPVKVKERREKREAEYKAERDRKNAHWNRVGAEKKLGQAAISALQQIADGHNNPRQLAIDTLTNKET